MIEHRDSKFCMCYECSFSSESSAAAGSVLKLVRCEYADATQHRSRVLTGSIGLEGAWTEWKDGKPERVAMNRQYEYRKPNAEVSGSRSES